MIDGRYRVEELVGKGAFGSVYRAIETLVGRDIGEVAVKIYHPLTDTAEELWTREVGALARVRHPNIVAYRTAGILQLGSAQQARYIVTDLGPSTLATQLAGRERLAWPEVHKLAIGLLRAAAALHDSGFVHGDLSPSNILVSSENMTNVQLIDFGTSGAVDEHPVGGTLGYMAPEVLAPRGRLSTAADIYSIGATLLYAVRDPGLRFERTTRISTDRVSFAFEQVSIEQLPTDVPTDLREVIRSMVDEDPSRRISTADALQRLERA